ncbi:hypothetical protein T01_6328 [Trichinella spiralis]|uniref:Uncharacterized protein n=1 Tax=Trichinella spiralis TaxID=6334 RepID=A0A0V1AQZ4_TRISP|nr:hypothetical protein T01_6328 [Trichinella spiralis]
MMHFAIVDILTEMFKEWSKENVKTRTTRSRTREEKRFKEWSKENVKTRTTRSRTREEKRMTESYLNMERRVSTKSIFLLWRDITNKEKKKRQRGRNAADRGPHEAEQEKTKFLGPQFCRSGIGIL